MHHCRGVTCATVDKIKDNLDLTPFIPDLDLSLGSPLPCTSLGSLDEKFRGTTSATTTSCLGHSLAKLGTTFVFYPLVLTLVV
jgi:hypothetical protein